MREEVISSAGTLDPTPAARILPSARGNRFLSRNYKMPSARGILCSVGASSPAVPTNFGSIDWSSHGNTSKATSLSCVGSQPPRTSLSTSASGSALGSSTVSCRPWERGDLLRRLSTFKPSNWFGKPKVASSLSCAQRGWINVDVDKLSCESCGAHLSFGPLPSLIPAEAESASEAFAKQLDGGHKVTCPWRGNCCLESLVQFPPTPQSALIGGYKDRCDGLQQFQYLPFIAASAIEHMRASRGPQMEHFLSQSMEINFKTNSIPELEISRDGPSHMYSRAQMLISLCGWEPRWLPNVQDCEENSAQSARNGCSVGLIRGRVSISQGPGSSKNIISASAKKDTGKNKMLAVNSRCEMRSPLLDCSLCGATVRILDFLTVPRPSRFTPNNIDIADTSKKMGLTRGASAASGISGWVAADDTEKEQNEDNDEVATTSQGRLPQNTAVDLNLTMAGGLPFIQIDRNASHVDASDADMGRDLIIGQPAGSEVGDRATSYESRGPSSRKRYLAVGGEGTVIDRDGDEVTGGSQYPARQSKRPRESENFDTYGSTYAKESSGAGPSHSMGFDYADGNRGSPIRYREDLVIGDPTARDSTRASSVIAMDVIYLSENDDSMESVENYPGDVDGAQFPSSSTYGNLDIYETSELNCSNQAQQSVSFRPAVEVVPGEMGLSSTNDGEEVFNAETVTAQAREGGASFGISGGSVGMCASHEAEIHGVDASLHRTHSVVGDLEIRLDDADNQGQTGESASVPVLTDEVVPDEINQEDPPADSQEMFSRSLGRADSGSKVDGFAKEESTESGEKISQHSKIGFYSSAHPSLSCNAIMDSGCETTNTEVAKAGKSSSISNCAYPPSENAVANGIGPPKWESSYEDPVEFDPIVHHNQFCPWVNGNVAAAGCSTSVPSTGADAVALCGWQLTLEALDALRSLGHIPVLTVQSESAASLHKDDHRTPSQKHQR